MGHSQGHSFLQSLLCNLGGVAGYVRLQLHTQGHQQRTAVRTMVRTVRRTSTRTCPERTMPGITVNGTDLEALEVGCDDLEHLLRDQHVRTCRVPPPPQPRERLRRSRTGKRARRCACVCAHATKLHSQRAQPRRRTVLCVPALLAAALALVEVLVASLGRDGATVAQPATYTPKALCDTQLWEARTQHRHILEHLATTRDKTAGGHAVTWACSPGHD